MIADLPMYDWPAIRAATDAFWEEVAGRLRAAGTAAPPRLCRGPHRDAAWRDPGLLLGQTCGMPYVSGHCGEARIVARPDYGLPGAKDGWYRSAIVVRAEDGAGSGPEAVLARQGCRVAVNEWRSYSGHIALRDYLAALRPGAGEPFFGSAALSGGHLLSARMVACREADMAALDGVVWALLGAHEPEIAGRLAVIGMTAPAPALPFITAAHRAPQAADIAAALDAAARALAPVTGLPRAVLPATESDYNPVRRSARRAAVEAFAPGAPSIPDV